MSANLSINPIVPSEFSPAVPMTTSDFVVSRRFREYVADANTNFSFDGNNIIKFTLNSADAFLDGRNSWIQFKLHAAISSSNLADYLGLGGIADVSGEKLARYLESGGAHSLFSRLRISLSNGTIISDYDYSQLYAMVRQHTMSFQHLEYQEGPSSFDGAASDIYDYDKQSLQRVFDYSVITHARALAAAYDFGLRRLRFVAGEGAGIKVGDEIAIIAKANAPNGSSNVIYGKVISNDHTDVFLSTDATQSGQDIDYAAGDINAVAVIRRGDSSHRTRGALGTNAAPVLCKIKLFSDFFNNIKYLPLPFLRNLTIELTLNRSAHAVVFTKSLAAGNNPALAWVIRDPVVVANLVTPSEQLMNAYVDEYNSEKGIMLHWIDYQSNKVSAISTASSENIRIPSNCHSALAVLVAQKLPEAQAVNADSWMQDTNGVSVKQLMTSYQFMVGSEYFPFARPVDASGTTNGNAWNYVLQALDSHGAKYECSSIIPSEYYSVNSITRPQAAVNIADESLRFIMATRLDRDGNYTGIDTSNNDIQLNVIRSGNPVAGLYYHAFIVHNRLMRISKSSTI
jgi:hypothetical protein